jgi:hypothetical protein
MGAPNLVAGDRTASLSGAAPRAFELGGREMGAALPQFSDFPLEVRHVLAQLARYALAIVGAPGRAQACRKTLILDHSPIRAM